MAEGVTGLRLGRRVVRRFAATTAFVVVVTGGVAVATTGTTPDFSGAVPGSPHAAVPTVDRPEGGASASPGQPAGRPLDLPVRADAIRDEQWQLRELRAEAAWQVSTGRGVTVAVIDSGVDASHPDLAGQVLPGLDLVAGSGNGQHDPVGHGTTVATLIAGHRDDPNGAVGLAPDARILPVRVLDAENRYDDALIVARGVRWAVDNGARVINLSLGGNGDSPALAAALDYAFARDVVVVACTGNVAASMGTEVWYPAREPGVIAVAGLERESDALWTGSVTGPQTVLTAPATGLVSARPGGFWRVQGTSFAAPLVAASAALVRARWPQMPAGDVVNRLLTTARDLGPAGRDNRFGYGLVDPVAALNGEVSQIGRNPLDDQSSPGVAGFGSAPKVAGKVPAADTSARPDLPDSTGPASPGTGTRPATRPTLGNGRSLPADMRP
ncbi:type VII secretion-associated serine protease mycosin [Micromonospora sp. CPCC 206060]|uniref:type VII secretion-associated serine protease mycosin n=1 Tax=Micromonospora sp. CPCC 206060 TaxID=3122406 RepID=UPI002FF2969D